MGEDRISPDMERYPVQEAAEILGISEGALRNRLHRGTLQSVKEGGTVYVLLSRRDTADKPRDTERDTGEISGESGALISEMRDRIAFLERELERKDAILLNMTEAMKAIAPPAQEESSDRPPEAPKTATEETGRVGAQPAVGGSEEGTERVPWWRRILGG